jgi:hypothetical protein
MANTLPKDDECQWIGSEGEYVSGTLAEHFAFLEAEQANPAAAVAVIEKQIAVAQAATPAAVVEKVNTFTEPQLRGLARAISARHAELKLDQTPKPKASGTGHRTAFTGSTGLARACKANRNFRVAASSPKAKATQPGLTGLARAIAANKRAKK